MVPVRALRSLASVIVAFLLLLGLATNAHAGDPSPQAEPAAPLTDRDFEILERGTYGTGEIVGGGLLGTLVGFGTGHAAQGRWRDTGWIYTAGESASFLVLAGGAAACSGGRDDDDDDEDLRVFSDSAGCVVIVAAVTLGTFAVFRIAEIVDVWATPQVHNKRFREIEAERARQALRWSPYVAPHGAGGASFGVALRF